jgi:putative ABC transport system permease protein
MQIVVLTTSGQHFNMLLLIIFGSSALLMAAIGIYGLMVHSVQQRMEELGIRMALGAQAAHIRNMVIRQGMVLALIGVVIGIGGAFWLSRFLAGWIPARRATRVDPMTGLRVESLEISAFFPDSS